MCVCELSVSLSIHKVNMFTSCTQAKFTPTASSSSSPWSTNIQTKAKIIKGYRLQNYMWHSGNKCIVFLYLLCILFVRDHTQYTTMFTLIGTIIQIDCSTYTQIPPPSQHFKSIKQSLLSSVKLNVHIMHVAHLTDSVQRRSGTSHVGVPRGQRSEASPESPPASRWTHNPGR